MTEFQQFIYRLQQTENKSQAKNSSYLPPRKFPKRQYNKFGHRIEISLLIIFILAGSGAIFSHYWQSRHIQATTQYHQSKPSNNRKLIQPAKIHHHSKRKPAPKQHKNKMVEPVQSQLPVNTSIPATNLQPTSLYVNPRSKIAPAETDPNHESAENEQYHKNYTREPHNKAKIPINTIHMNISNSSY